MMRDISEYVNAAAQALGPWGTAEAITGLSRLRVIVAYRHAGIAAARQDGHLSKIIAAGFSRDRATILYACKNADPDCIKAVREAMK